MLLMYVFGKSDSRRGEMERSSIWHPAWMVWFKCAAPFGMQFPASVPGKVGDGSGA